MNGIAVPRTPIHTNSPQTFTGRSVGNDQTGWITAHINAEITKP